MIKKKSIYIFLTALTAILILGIFFIFNIIFINRYIDSFNEIIMPDFRSMNYHNVRVESEKLYLMSEFYFQNSTEYDSNTVMRQIPAAGRKVKSPRIVKFLVSKGLDDVVVPDLSNLSVENAQIVLFKSELAVGDIIEVINDTYPQGIIMNTYPPFGDIVKKSTKINLFTARPSEEQKISLPDLRGIKEKEATTLLSRMNLRMGPVERIENYDHPPNTVIRQNPPAGSFISENTSVGITVTYQKGLETGQHYKRTSLFYTVPPGLRNRQVKIVIQDLDGTNVIYEQATAPGERIMLNFRIKGQAYALIYIDGALNKREILK